MESISTDISGNAAADDVEVSGPDHVVVTPLWWSSSSK